jgi:dTDP-4-dehydrorhamnose reductase
MKILLTGCTGQVGHYLSEDLRDHELLMPTRQQLDLSEPEQIRTYVLQHRPELIINPAAYTAVDLAESEGALAHRINAEAPRQLALVVKELGIGLIHFSTDYVFQGDKLDQHGSPAAYKESDATGPIGVYGASKLAGENAILDSNCKHLIFRTSWVYSGWGKNFLLTMLRLARERDSLKVVNDQWGTPTSAAWLSKIIVQIVRDLQATNDPQNWWQTHQGIYHLTAEGITNWCAFAEQIMRSAQCRNLIVNIPTITGITTQEYPTPARRPHNSYLDKSKFTQSFGIALPTWQSALEDCLDQMAHH